MLKALVAAALVSLGVYRLWRHRHPRFGGMQVGFRDLAIWSFLMASAHGAGLMVLPFVMATTGVGGGEPARRPCRAPGPACPSTRVLAVALHSAAYLAVTAAMAWVVYRWMGLAILRTAWFNLDWLWAGALVVTGLVVMLV